MSGEKKPLSFLLQHLAVAVAIYSEGNQCLCLATLGNNSGPRNFSCIRLLYFYFFVLFINIILVNSLFLLIYCPTKNIYNI